MTGVCLFACVVRPGPDPTSHALVRNIASQATGSYNRLTKKRNRVPISGGWGCENTICVDVCSSPTSCMLCLLRSLQTVSRCCRSMFQIILYSSISKHVVWWAVAYCSIVYSTILWRVTACSSMSYHVV